MAIGSSLYAKFIEKNLSLADQLAAARSILSNERTFLSYQRTALTLFIAGFTFIKFFEGIIYQMIGILFLPAAILTIALGVYRYLRMRNLIWNLEIEHIHFEKDMD